MPTLKTNHTILFFSGNGGLSDNGYGETWHIEDEMAKSLHR